MRISEIELQDLRCLVTLAGELNFGRAAERLHMSQPPLTRLVADVEKALGAKLFARTTRRVELTPLGEVFVAEARAVLGRMDEALQTVIATAERQHGQLRLSYTWLALQTAIPGVLAAFREQDHDARVDLIELPDHSVRAALDAGQIDMAFTNEPVPGNETENVLLSRTPLCLSVSHHHPLAVRKSIEFAEIAETPLILHPRHEYPGYYDQVMAACEAAGFRPVIHHREPGQNCVALALTSAGALLTPRNYAHPVPGLACIPVDFPVPIFAEVWACWRKQSTSPRLETLIRFVRLHHAASPS